MTANQVAEVGLKYLAEVAEQVVPESCLCPPGYKQAEVGVIPEDWDVCRLQDAVDFLDGLRRPIKSGDRAKIFGIYPYYGASGIVDYVNDYIFDDELILMGEDGENILSRNSPLAFGVSGKIWVNNHAHVMKPKAHFDIGYLTEFLESLDYSLLNSGTVQPKLNKQTCLKMKVVKPGKKEQTAIANALSAVDALISKLEKLIVKKQAIKTAAMQQLLSGRTRLPPFGFKESALREDGSKKGYKHTELGEIPEDWEVKSYGEIFTFLSTSTNSRADLSTKGDFGYVHYGDIHTDWNNKLDLSKVRLPKISQHLISSAFLEEGDVIMADASEDYEGISKSVEVYNIGKQRAVAGLHTFLLRDREKQLSDGYRGYLHSIPVVKSIFDRLATGMKVYGISKSNLSAVLVPVPSKKEQTAIASILSDMDEEIQALAQRLGKTRQIKQGMMQELLTGKTRLVKPGKEERENA